MIRYLLAFAFAVTGLFAVSEGIVESPFHWDSHVEVQGILSGDDVRQIHFAVQRFSRGDRYPLTRISRNDETGVVSATYSRTGNEVPGTGGLICSAGTTYTLEKKGGKWKVVSNTIWMS